MKWVKTKEALAVSALLTVTTAQAAITHTMTGGNFAFYDSSGVLGATHNNVQAEFDFNNGSGQFTSSTQFIGATWVADINAIDFFNPTNIDNTYSWTTEAWFIGGLLISCNIAGTINDCEDENASGGLFVGSTTDSYSYQLTNSQQYGVEMFFSWNGIVVPMLTVLQLDGDPFVGPTNAVSIDSDGDGIPGHALNSDPKPGQTIAFSGTIVPAVPIPAAVWLFGSGLLALTGLARRKKVLF